MHERRIKRNFDEQLVIVSSLTSTSHKWTNDEAKTKRKRNWSYNRVWRKGESQKQNEEGDLEVKFMSLPTSQVKNKPMSPSHANDKPVSPSQANDKPVSPSNANDKSVSPSQVKAKSVSPSNANDKPVSPSNANDKPVSPSQIKVKSVSPSKANDKPVSPSQVKVKSVSPSKANDKPVSPSNTNDKPVSPSQVRIKSVPQSKVTFKHGPPHTAHGWRYNRVWRKDRVWRRENLSISPALTQPSIVKSVTQCSALTSETPPSIVVVSTDKTVTFGRRESTSVKVMASPVTAVRCKESQSGPLPGTEKTPCNKTMPHVNSSSSRDRIQSPAQIRTVSSTDTAPGPRKAGNKKPLKRSPDHDQ